MQTFMKLLYQKLEELKGKKVILLYHFDVDGCSSASILHRIFKKLNLLHKSMPITRGYEKSIASKIKQKDIDKIILVDYVPHKDFVPFLKEYNTLIIDHHRHENFLEVLDYLTSEDYGSNIAISYTLFKLAKDYYNIFNIEWIAKVSSFWEKCIEFTEFYEEDIYLKKIDEYLPFNILTNFTALKGSKLLTNILDESSSIEEALEKIERTHDYQKAFLTFKEEIKIIEASKKSIPELKIDIYSLKTKFKHIRIYVDYISFKSKGTTIFILDEKIDLKFSFRTFLDIDLEKIVKKIASENPNFSGGGHKTACGGILKGNNLNSILNRFIELYSEIYFKKSKIE